MAKTIDLVKKYLMDTLGLPLDTVRWAGADTLPQYLRASYDIFIASLMGEPLLLAVDRREQEEPPAILGKELSQLRNRFEGEVVYVHTRVTSYHRRGLVRQKVPFIVPGNQMYLPTLGVDFREHFRRERRSPEKLSPACQLLLLCFLQGRLETPLTPERCARALKYTAMSMSRAFDEVESAGLGMTIRSGRQRVLDLEIQGQELWSEALRLLATPVKKRVFALTPVEPNLGMKTAGLTALARFSALAAPAVDMVAVDGRRWRELSTRPGFAQIPHPEEGCIELEIWKYRPELLTGKEMVDRLSLYLSLRDTNDERVEAALEEMMEGFAW